MTDILEAARELLDWLSERKTPACLIGGLAVHRWGEPRFTRDVDVTALAPFGEEAAVIDACLARFSPRRLDAREFALNYRILLVKASNDVPLDVSLGAIDFELEVLERASPHEFQPGIALRTCSAEDLIVQKCVAARPQDWLDIRGILNQQLGNLDLDRVRHWLDVFKELKEDPDLTREFDRLLREAHRKKH